MKFKQHRNFALINYKATNFCLFPFFSVSLCFLVTDDNFDVVFA